MKFIGHAAALLAVLGIGCKGSDQPYQPVTPQPTASTSPSSTAPPKPAEAANPPLSKKEGSSLIDVSDSLKNDAYRYYGLNATKEKTYRFSAPGSPERSQIVTVSATKLGSDKVLFDEADLPTTTQAMSLDSTGIYVDSLTPQTLKTPHFLELPAKLSAGVTWTSHQWVESGPNSLDETLKNTVVGTKKVSVPAGNFEALYVVGNGDGKFGGNPAQTKVESWYVKDLGLVKQTLTMTGKGTTTRIDQILQK